MYPSTTLYSSQLCSHSHLRTPPYLFKMFNPNCFLLLSLLTIVSAKTVTYNWALTWVNRSPDGFSRPVIGINNQWPCPSIEADIGDRIVINVENKLGNETSSIHFHGLFQRGTNGMDGPVGVTQCPIPVGEKFTYDFKVGREFLFLVIGKGDWDWGFEEGRRGGRRGNEKTQGGEKKRGMERNERRD